jgi:hypothetical protein
MNFFGHCVIGTDNLIGQCRKGYNIYTQMLRNNGKEQMVVERTWIYIKGYIVQLSI